MYGHSLWICETNIASYAETLTCSYPNLLQMTSSFQIDRLQIEGKSMPPIAERRVERFGIWDRQE